MNTTGSQWEENFPSELRQEEAKAILTRRARARKTKDDSGSTASLVAFPSDTVGVALSGGGIRSATFCLGFFQALAKHGLLRKIDYLSTVSGGGYFGAFLGRWFVRSGENTDGSPGSPVDEIEAKLADCHSEPLKWLRENGRYISPNGAGDTWLAVAAYLRSWVGLHFVLSLLILTTFLFADMLRLTLWSKWLWWWNLETLFRDSATPWHYWSTYIVLPAVTSIVIVIPLGWAFWLTQTDLKNLGNLVPLFNTLVVLMGSSLYVKWGGNKPCLLAGKFLVITSSLAIGYWLVVSLCSIGKNAPARLRFTQNMLSKFLARGVIATVVLGGFALIDSLGQTFHAHFSALKHPFLATGGGSLLVGFVAFAQQLATLLQGRSKNHPRLPFSSSLILTVIALLVLTLILAFWSLASYVIWWSVPCTNSLLIAFLIALVFSITSGQTMKFLNLSSQQQLYAQRLARAYLGASNTVRWRDTGHSVSEVIDGDDLPFMEYAPHSQGGPLHLINVTINETVDGRSQLEQRDRKGIPMMISACGISAGLRHHALWLPAASNESFCSIRPVADGRRFHMFASKNSDKTRVENLLLGNWVGISGAAFSTGLGAHTNLGLSLLLGLANVRLGYWWNSGVRPASRAERTRPDVLAQISEALSSIFGAEAYLYEELLARFHGPARQRWYLSDGGHFENTACYELLRRRVPFIIVCDDGQDADYRFDDLGGLVRKARLDFNADIRFFTRADIENYLDASLHTHIGTLQELRRFEHPTDASAPDREGRFASGSYSEKHATLAWVHYDDPKSPPGSVILFVKPTLTGDERLDVLEYHESHADFPQEPTSDQFFDEAQWESYRYLGEHIGEMLFGMKKKEDSKKWFPRDMTIPNRG